MKALLSLGTVTAKVALVAAAALGGTAIVSSSVFASLTATASNTSGGSVSSGTLNLTQAASGVAGITGGFITAISTMAPGDTVNRYINLTNGGTLAGQAITLAIAASPSNALTTNGTIGLKVTVSECSVAWTSAGICSGTTTVGLAQASLLSLATPATLTLSSLASLAVNYLQFSITLPAGSEVTNNGALPGTTVQGLNTAVTWNFLETLRTTPALVTINS